MNINSVCHCHSQNRKPIKVLGTKKGILIHEIWRLETVWIKTSNLYTEINYFMKDYLGYIHYITALPTFTTHGPMFGEHS
jgi:hypothetical protein